jgi:GDP-4-dehydro-6-deoxy-D-mannose reductase
MTILVTGSNGFAAGHLVRYLRTQGCDEICGTDVTSRPEQRRTAGDPDIDFFQCNLAGEEAVKALIEHVRPGQIYHLAGTFTNDFRTDYVANVLTSRNLLECVRRSTRACRILLVGSSAEYGLVAAADNPVNEEHQLRPVSLYGLTKVYQTYLAKFYFDVHKSDVVIARPFNFFGRGISRQLFVGRVYEQIEAYRSGKISKISVGSLDSRRDYIAIEDAVRAFEAIMCSGVAGEIYNVGSGSSLRIRDLLERLLTENGLEMEVVQQSIPSTGDKVDVTDLFADIRKLRSLSKS